MSAEKPNLSSYLQSRIHDDYVKINFEWLKIGRSYEFDIFVLLNDQYVLFCRKDLTLTNKMASKLQKKSSLFIDKRDSRHFQAYMEENISDIIKDSSKPIKEKSEAVYAVSTNLVNDLLEAPKAQSINKVKHMVSNQIEFVMNNPGAVNSLMSITEHDYYTYTHSVNVAIYLVGLGEQMELSSEEIRNLSLGGMLHDLGKAKISLDIINSTGKLTDEQFEEMKKHPDLGVEILKQLDAESNMVPECCYYAIHHHHERYCGGGYPNNLKGKEIHLYGRMTKVCDIFDALTTKRSYKNEMSSFDSLTLMKEKMTEELDPDIFDHFLKLMANFSVDQRQKGQF